MQPQDADVEGKDDLRSIAPVETDEPRRVFATHPFLVWVKEFLSRPEIEEALSLAPQDGRHVTDIRTSRLWRELKDKNDSPFFGFPITWVSTCSSILSHYTESQVCAPLKSLRFSRQLKLLAGKKYSAGNISFYCLSLPPHLRYRPENVFLAAVAPGPVEPSVGDQINNILTPVIDDFVQAFEHGLSLTMPSSSQSV